MANDNNARGLYPLNWPYVPGNWYRVDTATDIFIGMPVDLSSTGYVVPTIVNSAGAVNILGAAMAFAGTLKRGTATNDPYLDVSDLTPPDPTAEGGALGDRWVYITDSPNQEYVVQGDTGATIAGLAAAGECVALLYRTTSGNTSSGYANLELDISTNVAQGSGQMILLRLHDQPNSDGSENAAAANYSKWVCRVAWPRKISGFIDTAV